MNDKQWEYFKEELCEYYGMECDLNDREIFDSIHAELQRLAWQDISTAPRDGRQCVALWIHHDGEGVHTEIFQWCLTEGNWVVGNGKHLSHGRQWSKIKRMSDDEFKTEWKYWRESLPLPPTPKDD